MLTLWSHAISDFKLLPKNKWSEVSVDFIVAIKIIVVSQLTNNV